jgi:Rieske Fe-S protein
MQRTLLFASFVLATLGCNTVAEPPRPEPVKPAPTAATPKSPSAPEAKAALKLGAPIEAQAKETALTEVAKDPKRFSTTPFVTTGTVSAVCQHMGCWMELKDDAGQAHVKMAGHAFFVPKTASGKRARVSGTVIAQETGDGCGEGHAHEGAKPGEAKKGCKAEAEAQLGRPLAKLELVATGVEILD